MSQCCGKRLRSADPLTESPPQEAPTKAAYGLASVAMDVFKGDLQLATEELKEKRLMVCKKCPHLAKLPFGVNGTGNCTKCGCFVDAKTKLAKSACPISKW